MHLGPALHPVVQSVHIAAVPHAPSAVPAAHVVPVQHPPLHALWFGPPHAVPHLCVEVSHACPAPPAVAPGQSVATSQPQVSVDGSHLGPPLPAVQTAHVPEPPHAPGWLPTTHVLPEQHVPAPQVPLPAAPQAAVQLPDVHVGVAPVHGVQACPVEPHVAFCVPTTQFPEPLQQPPLHAWLAEHLVVHCPVTVSQASSLGQSVVAPQPHVPLASHTWPFAEVVQSVHLDPVGPHALGAFPATHEPPLEQQPALQAVVPAPHVVEHVCVVVLQA